VMGEMTPLRNVPKGLFSALRIVLSIMTAGVFSLAQCLTSRQCGSRDGRAST
jgi:hypothetical protein